MVCEHLRAIEEDLKAGGAKETYRGRPWTDNCREWLYFDTVIDVNGIRERLKLPTCVSVRENLDERSGTERGFFCEECKDGVMGLLKERG